MATEKKDYVDITEALTMKATRTSIRNKLSKVRARTEDQRLKVLVDSAIHSLDQSSVYGAAPLRLTTPEYDKLFRYCEQVRASIKPQWQILAETNGWVPNDKE